MCVDPFAEVLLSHQRHQIEPYSEPSFASFTYFQSSKIIYFFSLLEISPAIILMFDYR